RHLDLFRISGFGFRISPPTLPPLNTQRLPPMPMTQQCIQKHYEGAWKTKSDAATHLHDITYSSPIEDAIVYPLYRQMIADVRLKVTGGEVLDVGSGAGRWIRF